MKKQQKYYKVVQLLSKCIMSSLSKFLKSQEKPNLGACWRLAEKPAADLPLAGGLAATQSQRLQAGPGSPALCREPRWEGRS